MNQLPMRHLQGRREREGLSLLATVLPPGPGDYSASNRRTSSCFAQRAYPWLLLASTAVAGLFCLLYITKPVFPASSMIPHAAVPPAAAQPTAIPAPAAVPVASPESATASLAPSRSALPGETSPADAEDRSVTLPGPPSISAFEETNLRVQHVLTADSPGGSLDRIVLDVPVLYQSRNLRWTATEVTQARSLLVQLMGYQEKCRALRAEGKDLLGAWNRLIEQSLPGTELRADSPSLPANQLDAADSARPPGLLSSESIQIRPAAK